MDVDQPGEQMSQDRPGRRLTRPARPARLVAAGLVAGTVLLTAACQSGTTGTDPGGPPSTASGSPSASSTAPGPTPESDEVSLTFGVFGPRAETASFRRVVDSYNQAATATTVDLVAYPDREALVADLGTPRAPDVFLASRRDLDRIVGDGLNAPLLELLDERGVDYGDGYSRDALLAFSADDDLQCMPYGISPTVVYYNTDLIDFEDMRERGLPVPPTDLRGWNLDMFAAAADEATRPRLGTRGVHVDATLRGLAPFVYSGAGQLFDDEEEPTSLDLEDEDARDALTRTLALLRDPLVTLTGRQLRRASPLEWFERGRLGMVTGTRSLVPRLRDVEGLDFDVMPMPLIDDQVTVGDMTGLCISSDNENLARTADFLVTLIGDEAVAEVAREGYLVPANLEVALGDEFLQPLQMPRNANIFNTSVRDLVVNDLLDPSSPLAQAVQPAVRDLFTAPTLDDLDQRTTLIDTVSRSVLDPDYPPPSEGPSDQPSTDPDDLPSSLPSESEVPDGLDD